jgi:hypothetical protein
MQVTNATVPVVVNETTLFDQINAVATQISVLVTIIGGIVTYAITNYRKATNKQLTERDKQMLELSKQIQMGFQKGVETIGSNKELAKTLYEMNLSTEQRKQIEEKIQPILAEADTRLQTANEQAALIKAKAVSMFGQEADVDQDKTIPRESPSISAKLRKV